MQPIKKLQNQPAPTSDSELNNLINPKLTKTPVFKKIVIGIISLPFAYFLAKIVMSIIGLRLTHGLSLYLHLGFTILFFFIIFTSMTSGKRKNEKQNVFHSTMQASHQFGLFVASLFFAIIVVFLVSTFILQSKVGWGLFGSTIEYWYLVIIFFGIIRYLFGKKRGESQKTIVIAILWPIILLVILYLLVIIRS